MIDTSWHEGLRNVPGFSLPVLSSAGLESRASRIAERVVKAHRFLSKILEFTPPSALLVLSIADWPVDLGPKSTGCRISEQETSSSQVSPQISGRDSLA